MEGVSKCCVVPPHATPQPPHLPLHPAPHHLPNPHRPQPMLLLLCSQIAQGRSFELNLISKTDFEQVKVNELVVKLPWQTLPPRCAGRSC